MMLDSEEVRMFLEDIRGKVELDVDFQPLNVVEDRNVRIGSVDSGSAIVLDGGSWCIAAVRYGTVVFQDRKCIYENVTKPILLGMCRTRIYVLTNVDPELKGILKRYSTEEFRVPEGKSLEEVWKDALAIIRRLVEMYAALKSDCDILLMDFPLTFKTNTEKKVLTRLVKEKTVLGVAKSCRVSDILGVDLGIPVTTYLKAIKPNDMWYVYIGKKSLLEEYIDDYVAKLHPSRDARAYRISIPTYIEDIKGILGKVAYYSTDPSLPGYPFPLLYIDSIVRMRKDEVAILRHSITSNIEELLKIARRDVESVDTHSIMDRLAYPDSRSPV